jgi:hypothetical protein
MMPQPLQVSALFHHQPLQTRINDQSVIQVVLNSEISADSLAHRPPYNNRDCQLKNILKAPQGGKGKVMSKFLSGYTSLGYTF